MPDGLFSETFDNGNGGLQISRIGRWIFSIHSWQLILKPSTDRIRRFENHLPSTSVDYPNTKGNISANMFRIGIQPNFGYKSKYFTAALSARIANLSYSKIEGDLIFDKVDQVSYLKDNASQFLLEPALTVTGFGEN